MQKYGGRVAEVWGKGCTRMGEGLQKSGGRVAEVWEKCDHIGDWKESRQGLGSSEQGA